MKKNKRYGLQVSFDGLCVDFGHASLNKKKEYLCGDYYKIAENDNDHVLVLSDGLGSGVKANILSTLTATMLCNMVINGVNLGEAVRAVAETLPVCSVRQLAYSTFTVLDIMNDGVVSLYQYDNPDVIVLRDGKPYPYAITRAQVDEKTLLQSVFPLKEGDMLILMSDGVTNAGMGKTTNGGWGLEAVTEFCQKKYREDMSAREMAVDVAEASVDLNLDETDDDITVIVLKVRKKQQVNLMIGPPGDAEKDTRYLKKFFDSEGMHVICGGTTAQMAARYLEKDVSILPDSGKNGVPVCSALEGVDLVTEGFLTLERLLEYCEEWRENGLCYRSLLKKEDGAAQIGKILFDTATDIQLFFGNAVNEGNESIGLSKERKEEMIEQLLAHLKKAGKNVEVAFWAV